MEKIHDDDNDDTIIFLFTFPLFFSSSVSPSKVLEWHFLIFFICSERITMPEGG